MSTLSPLPPPPVDLVQHSTWTSMHATAVHVLPGMLRYLGVAEDDIDDLSQEVLLGAYTSLPRYNPAYPAAACGSASLPPVDSPLLHDIVSAVPGAAADTAQEKQEQDDPASLPPPELRNPPRPSRPHGLGPRWRVECSWLFGIAWRKVRRHLERTYRRLEVPVGLSDEACFQGADVAPSSEQRIATNQRIAIATRLLATIAPERRAILIMADMVEIPVREIARSLELNENTDSSRLRLAREDFRAAVKRLRPEEQRALRSGLLMVPLFSLASSRSAASPAVHSGASAVVETSAPATRPEFPSDLGRQDLADRPGRAARLARLLARFARPALARFILPALAWATAGVGGAALFAALAPAPALWANRLGPIATPLLLSRAVGLDARPETGPGGRPRSEAPRADAISDKEAPPSRAPTPAPASVSRPRKPAAPEQHAPSDQDREPLADELQLLAAARQALLQGDRATALERIAAHERRFPEGRLKLTRERLRSKAAAAQAAPAGSAAGQTLP
ncbi:RNA polymerase sigma factor [Sorangium atrum]|uniref:Sigma-70 family RNA polymerase sigma factor n=1 Tax=Sorangium atrum TaxID=2995308 RepID=A0ABT5C1P6_9BACT|nr:sigma-70 family RNA polymerase sigma factor [Sorangium aterium]MDC0680321.1 sigma-70 family RNA polymerase sigma factor [Sorangium aterium]